MSTNIFRVGAERHRSKVMKIKINKEKRREKRESERESKNKWAKHNRWMIER